MPERFRPTVRVIIWLAIVVFFLRGIESFDSGGSAGAGTIAAGACIAGSLVAAAVMFCFDRPDRR